MKGMLSCILILSSIFMAGCISNPPKEQLQKYVQGQVFETLFPIANHEVPLPEGKWKFISVRFTSNDVGQSFANLHLLKTDDVTFTDGVFIRSSLNNSGSNGFVQSRFCERSNILFAKVFVNERGADQDCWGINYFRTTRGKNTDQASLDALEYIKANKIKRPNFAVYTQHRLTENNSFLMVQYYSNPEYYTDIAPVPMTSWDASEWHTDLYYRDSKKEEYIEKLKLIGSERHENLKLGGFY
ncbi:hypothetical protein [Amphritea sp. HPY]|uniref:hypothetical protein n=1 Tax=Amphritea sp. HPY TaxID=3421652 RepID=UPI003D7ECB9E